MSKSVADLIDTRKLHDAIDRAALHDEVEYRLRTAAAHYRSCGKHGTDPGDFLDREIEAMTERLAGLIAPAPLREEWGTRFGGYVVEGRTDAEYPFFWKGVPPPGVNVHRYRTDWLPADGISRAEDAGNAAVNHAGRRIRKTIETALQAEP